MALSNTAMNPSPLREAALREAPLGSTQRFVIFPLGGEPYALDSARVLELVMAARVFRFPHTMPTLEGVLVRRGTAVPVCDMRRVFREQGQRSLYVIAKCRYEGGAYIVAIPVSGACELKEGEPLPAAPSSAAPLADEPLLSELSLESAAPQGTFVAGLLRTGETTVPLLDLDQLVAHCMKAPQAVHREGRQ
jgi:chemotaxis signal transduction protein